MLFFRRYKCVKNAECCILRENKRLERRSGVLRYINASKKWNDVFKRYINAEKRFKISFKGYT